MLRLGGHFAERLLHMPQALRNFLNARKTVHAMKTSLPVKNTCTALEDPANSRTIKVLQAFLNGINDPSGNANGGGGDDGDATPASAGGGGGGGATGGGGIAAAASPAPATIERRKSARASGGSLAGVFLKAHKTVELTPDPTSGSIGLDLETFSAAGFHGLCRVNGFFRSDGDNRVLPAEVRACALACW